MTTRWVPLRELELSCTRCGHQGAVHTKGADRTGWAIYVEVWRNATGGCSSPECPCPERITDPTVQPLPPAVTPEVLATLAPILSEKERKKLEEEREKARPNGPCGHGAGPCGRTPARLYPFGWRCNEHEPGADRVELSEAA